MCGKDQGSNSLLSSSRIQKGGEADKIGIVQGPRWSPDLDELL